VHVLARISSADKIFLLVPDAIFTQWNRVNERVTVLTHEQTTFILGEENMEPDQPFKQFLTSLTKRRDSIN
jgi:hypothetical protein